MLHVALVSPQWFVEPSNVALEAGAAARCTWEAVRGKLYVGYGAAEATAAACIGRCGAHIRANKLRPNGVNATGSLGSRVCAQAHHFDLR